MEKMTIVKLLRHTEKMVRQKEKMDAAVASNMMLTDGETILRRAASVFFLALFLWQTWLVYTTGSTTITLMGSSYVVLALLVNNSLGFGLSSAWSI